MKKYTNANSSDGAALTSEPLHAVEAHEDAVAEEEGHPHEDVATAARLRRQKDERDWKQKKFYRLQFTMVSSVLIKY